MRFHFRDGVLGLMSWWDPGKVVPIRDCHLQDEGANTLLRLVAAALRPLADAEAAQSSPAQASAACCQRVLTALRFLGMVRLPAKRLSGAQESVLPRVHLRNNVHALRTKRQYCIWIYSA